MEDKTISLQTLRRLPVYLHYLKVIRNDCPSISATSIADKFGLNDVQVRKDLAAVSGSGRPKTGYCTDELIIQIENYLGCRTETKTVLIGAGNLGKALLSYGGFSDYGINVIAAFDNSPDVYGRMINEKPVLSVADLEEVCKNKNIKLGIITVPASEAQHVCDELVSYGIKAIWNFAPTILRVPEGVLVENENLASSLAVLSKHLHKRS
ncbi:MAG: redox-sensing transcriptional repressor Rex, partial [Eubacteriales bacterium]